MESLNASQLYSIHEAYRRGLRSEKIDPRDQLPSWLVLGIMALEQGKILDGETIEEFLRMGGTDHNDPTLRSVGK